MKPALIAARTIALIMVAIVVAELCSCTPKPPQPVLAPTRQVQPKQNESASPKLDAARQTSGDADAQAVIAAERLAKVQGQATTAQQKAKAALDEAERLRVQKSATEVELTKQSKLVRELGDAIAGMEIDLAGVAQSLLNERNLRQKIGVMLVEAQALARDKDQEADTLRTQLNAAEVQSNQYFKAAEDNAKAAITAQGKVAAAEAKTGEWRKLTLWLGLCAIVQFIIFIVVPIVRKTSIGI